MLYTGICAFIPSEQAVLAGERIVVSAINWAEISLAARESGLATQQLAEAFAARLDAVLP